MKGLFAVIATAFLLSLSIGNVSASWGWNPDFDDWIDFTIGGQCSTNAQCGTDTNCIKYQCVFGTCQKAYAPINTPAGECQTCNGDGGSVYSTGTSCNNGAGICMPLGVGEAYCYTPTGIYCDDGNACTIDYFTNVPYGMENCQAINGLPQMFPRQQITCNDNNQLTIDSCNTQTGCVFTPIETPVVPEFGVIVGTLTVLSAVGMFFFIRRK